MKRLVLLLCGVLAGVEHLAAMTDAHEIKGADPVAMDVVAAHNDHALVAQILARALSMAERANLTALQYQNNPLDNDVTIAARRMLLRSIHAANQNNNNMAEFKAILAQISDGDTKTRIIALELQLRLRFLGRRQYYLLQEAVADVQAFYEHMVHGIMELTQAV